tara:strand:+ start:25 stop:774 length:750 start_codon:yes stop_codon:yes gene_type:complete
MKRNLEIKFIQKKPFCIFEIENFLSDNEYNILKNFPNFKKNELISTDKNKFELASNSDEYKSIKDTDCVNLLENIFDDKFFLSVTKKLKYQLLSSRSFNKLQLIKLLRFSKFGKNKNKKTIIERLFYNYFQYSYKFSYMFNDGYILPHTDGLSKLISLMLYFPTQNQENKSIGTTFYETKYKSAETIRVDMYEEDNIFFKNNFKESITLPFKKKNLYGFLKSDNSWHSVKKLYLESDEIRKSININVHI